MKRKHMPQLPPTAKSQYLLEKIGNQQDNDRVTVVQKKGKTYFFKVYPEESRLPEIETYGAAICKYFATSKYVPKMRGYYNEFGQLIGTTSKKIENYTSNYDDPLLLEDTYFTYEKDIKIYHLQEQLKHDIYELLNIYSKHKKTSLFAINLNIFSNEITVNQIISYLEKFQKTQNKFEQYTLNSLYQTLKKRQLQVNSKIKTSLEMEEEKKIRELKVSIKHLLDFPYRKPSKLAASLLNNIKFFEELESQQLHRSENNFKKRKIAKFFDQFERVKGQGITEATLFFIRQGDYNNSNFSKKGEIIDFEEIESPISSQFKNRSSIETILKQTNDETFAWSPNNIRFFPNIKTDLFYWLTKQPEVYKKIIAMCDNFMNLIEKDREEFKDCYPELAEIFYFYINHFGKQDITELSFVEIVKFLIYKTAVKIQAIYQKKDEKQIFQDSNVTVLTQLIHEKFNSFVDLYHKEIMNLEQNCLKALTKKKVKFREEDNVVFKALAANPVFQFYKYKTFLKIILTDVRLYRCLAKLFISDEPVHLKPSNNNSLIEIFVEAEIKRVNELRDTLLELDEFKTFIQEYGDYAFSSIKDECIAYKKEYEKKSINKIYYKELVDLIDVEDMEKEYKQVCEDIKPKSALSWW